MKFSQRVVACSGGTGATTCRGRHARPVPHLALRSHAAADAGGDGHPLLPALCQPFHDVQSLAAAALDDVMARGRARYYSRRATCIAALSRSWRSTAGVSRSADALAQLPGIGRSTAAAIAAFAYSERAAILDGNVKRSSPGTSASRLFQCGDDEREMCALPRQNCRMPGSRATRKTDGSWRDYLPAAAAGDAATARCKQRVSPRGRTRRPAAGAAPHACVRCGQQRWP